MLAGGPRLVGPVRLVLRFLRGIGVAPVDGLVAPASPVEVLLDEFEGWLRLERGLARRSIVSYRAHARGFLVSLGEPLREVLAVLDAARVTSFLLGHVAVLQAASAKASVTAIRALLRFLHLAGLIPVALAAAVPAVAGWRLASLPRAVPAGVVERLLAACDRSSVVGRRDLAMLMLLALLGLRAAEVAGLRLDDVDWRAGEVTVRGKGGRLDRLPLPVAAGEAIVAYLRGGRRRVACRALFMSIRAPYRSVSSYTVQAAVARACARAGLARFGAHRLRHTLASDLLRAGGSLAEIGQVLRHRSAFSTSLYAKVDERALAALARPWPERGA